MINWLRNLKPVLSTRAAVWVTGLVLPLPLLAQEGAVDGSFHSPLFNTVIPLISVEASGKILYLLPEDNSRFSIGRLSANGSVDAPVNIGDGPQSITAPIDLGTLHIPGATNPATINVIKPLANGQILVGGTFSHFNKVARKLLARLNANGSVDPSFNAGNGFVGDNVSSIAVVDGGRIYVGGKFKKFGNSPRNVGLVRLNADGSLDGSFVDSTISFGASVTDFSVSPAGQPLIDAAYANASFQPTFQVYRLGVNGGLDGSFAQGAGTPFTPAPILHALMNNGQILVTGGSGLYNGIAVNKALFRLKLDGTVDASFPGLTLQFSNIGGLISRFIVGSNGIIYLSGAFDSVNGQPRLGLARLKADGTLDPAFVPAAFVYPAPGALDLQGDGKILACSSVISGVEVKYNIVRFNGFGGGPAPGPVIGPLTVLSAGKFQLQVVGGTSTVVIETSVNLTGWQKIATNAVINGVVSFTDPLANQFQARYYRLTNVP